MNLGDYIRNGGYQTREIVGLNTPACLLPYIPSTEVRAMTAQEILTHYEHLYYVSLDKDRLEQYPLFAWYTIEALNELGFHTLLRQQPKCDGSYCHQCLNYFLMAVPKIVYQGAKVLVCDSCSKDYAWKYGNCEKLYETLLASPVTD